MTDFILPLFGIGKELERRTQPQKDIIYQVELPVGLPPKHYGALLRSLDISGFTLDYLVLREGRPDLSVCDSLEKVSLRCITGLSPVSAPISICS